MSFSFVDHDWHKVFSESASLATGEIFLITPFIQLNPVKELLGRRKIKTKLITCFDLNNFYEGVSDLKALEFLIDMDAEIKGIKNLHAKVYIFGPTRAIITSANFTQAALLRNYEFGLVTENKELIFQAKSYFEFLWNNAGDRLTKTELTKWKEEIDELQRSGGRRDRRQRLKDYGKEMGLSKNEPDSDVGLSIGSQWFVKFFGISSDRLPNNFSVLEEVQSSGSHWACTYPKGKRPRKVKDGAAMFIARLVKDPNDILIIGRAIGMEHLPGRDDATEADIKKRDWKAQWPHYIRVRDAEFVAGQLSNGVSLNELMEKFGSNSFASTERNRRLGHGNIEPRHAYLQQASVELTARAAAWLNEHLETAFRNHGKLSETEMAKLDWPTNVG
jgi:hypothetical protein